MGVVSNGRLNSVYLEDIINKKNAAAIITLFLRVLIATAYFDGEILLINTSRQIQILTL